MADVAQWLTGFAAALDGGDAGAVADQFLETGLWRDYLAFDWTLATHEGRAAIAGFAGQRARITAAANFSTEAIAGASEGFIAFETAAGWCKGYVRLVEGKALSPSVPRWASPPSLSC